MLGSLSVRMAEENISINIKDTGQFYHPTLQLPTRKALGPNRNFYINQNPFVFCHTDVVEIIMRPEFTPNVAKDGFGIMIYLP